jgi:hypothetical protein
MGSARPSTRTRPRIGLLCDSLSRYQTRVAGGAKRAALSLGADIVCFFGGYFTDGGKASNRFDASFVFDLARAPALDGLVVVTTVLANEVGVDYVREYCEKAGLPLVSVGSDEKRKRVSLKTVAARPVTLRDSDELSPPGPIRERVQGKSVPSRAFYGAGHSQHMVTPGKLTWRQGRAPKVQGALAPLSERHLEGHGHGHGVRPGCR